MINKKQEKRVELVESIISVTCDVCKTDYFDDMDIQEFLCIDEVGGYSSAFGDENRYKIDICSRCQYKLFGQFIQGNEGD